MTHQQAVQMATDWVALKSFWAELSVADQAAALAYFLLPENALMNDDLVTLVASYEAL